MTPRKPVQHLYVSVDTCAELGGQPYKVLEALHDLYDITKRRDLHVIETAQGLFEKSEYISPEMVDTMPISARKFSEFIRTNRDWVTLVETNTCRTFRNRLSNDVFSEMVDPLADLSEATMQIIQKESFAILQSRCEDHMHGKRIEKPADIDINIGFVNPDKEKTHTGFAEKHAHGSYYRFEDDIISEAADRALPYWKKQMSENKSLDKQARKKLTKSNMAMMVKSLQETKAITHCLLSDLAPEQAIKMGDTPEGMDSCYRDNDKAILAKLRDNSHLYANMTFPVPEQLGALQTTVQAVRLTSLWPWANKKLLSQESAATLRSIHRNTADIAYLDMFTDMLPDMSPSQDSAYILLTHDMPLRRQFLEVTTGIKEHVSKKQAAGDGQCHPSRIYESLHLHQRPIEDYPTELILVGSEFVGFAYREALAALRPYIEQHQASKLLDTIKNAGPDNDINVHDSFEQAIGDAIHLPDHLRGVLHQLNDGIAKMETYVERDIQAWGEVQKNGRYTKQKQDRLDARSRLSNEAQQIAM